MTTHDICHRLIMITATIAKAKRECGYVRDYDHALDCIKDEVAKLGDEIIGKGETL